MRIVKTALILIAAIGFVVLVAAMATVAQQQPVAAPVPVKQQSVSLPGNAFDDDPQLQRAAQNLQTGQNPTQTVTGPSSQGSSSELQNGATGGLQ